MKISVCIVTYNHERFVRQCIESVLAQETPFDFEIVVGEDCSKDGTLAILEDLAARHPGKLRIMARPKNLGAEKNFNKTISECQGEYVAFLEGDNYWIATDKLRKQAEFLDARPSTAFCFHRAVYIDADGARTGTVVPVEDPPAISGMDFLLQDFNPVPLGSMLVRRALLEGIEDWVAGLRIGDWPICMMLATKGAIGFIPEEMSIQRVHKGGAWQLLPEVVQVLNIVRALDHVAPRLDPVHQAIAAGKIERFNEWILDRLAEDPEKNREVLLRELRGNPDSTVTLDLIRAALARVDIEVKMNKAAREEARLSVEAAALERHQIWQSYVDGQRQLAKARRRPMRVLRDLWTFRAARFLARQDSIFPSRRIARFARSAAKRDPSRSLIEIGDTAQVVETKSQSGFTVYPGEAVRDPSRPDIILVSHEVSRTGAPILGLNLAQTLARRFNVTTISLREGALLDEFRGVSTDVYIAKRFRHEGSVYRSAIIDLCRKRPFAFAIVNSLESRGTLQGLNEAGVPIVSLIHEFSSYTNPKSAIMDVFKWSTETVFSTNVTLENALFENNLPPNPDLHVLPQGKCVVPRAESSDDNSAMEIMRLKRELRPDADTERRFVVIGAGSVIVRKGVDLFIEVATRVLGSPGGERFRFAWIGSGYNPEKDLGYSVYLRDQLHRAGIADRVLMLDETSEIEAAYELSDAFALSSRLDPLPNVAIDSLCAGRPVVCFDRTTGIADILKAHGLGDICVARYLDTSEMADRLLALAASEAAYEETAARCSDIAADVFDFEKYVATLCRIAETAQAKVRGHQASQMVAQSAK